MKGSCCLLLVASLRKCSHRELRLTGAEYKINDDQLRNQAAHSGLRYLGLFGKLSRNSP